MNCYQCPKCGEKWYSAAELEYLFLDRCCECGGKLEQATKDEEECEAEMVVIERDEAGMTRYFPEVVPSED